MHFAMRTQTKQETPAYVETFRNRKRLQSCLGYVISAAFEAQSGKNSYMEEK